MDHVCGAGGGRAAGRFRRAHEDSDDGAPGDEDWAGEYGGGQKGRCGW